MSDSMLKNCRSQGLPERKAGNASACAHLAHPGRGHRPCRSARLILGQPGAQSPRPAPAPPPAGAGLCWCGWHGSWWQRSARAGETQCVSCSRPHRRKPFHRCHGRGHRPCHSAALIPGQPGAKAPGQRPPRPWRALHARRDGRWPAVAPGPDDLRGTVPRRAGETQCVSRSRPKGQSLSPDREEFPGRQAVGLLFQHRARQGVCAPWRLSDTT